MTGHSALPRQVVFACVHNAGRSQMAAALFNELANYQLAKAVSAGTRPGAHVHPEVLTAMAEVGVDLSDSRPQLLTPELARGAVLLITMGCGEECPLVPGVRREDWPLEDPKGKSVGRVREIRDEIRRRVVALLAREEWARSAQVALELRAASKADLPRIEAILKGHRLPLDGVTEQVDRFLVAVVSGEIAAVACAERYGNDRLLRSVAVEPTLRNTGLGGRLVGELLRQAERERADTVGLLTTTAEQYFARFGFRRVRWEELPASLSSSAELKGACPRSAAAMLLDLRSRR